MELASSKLSEKRAALEQNVALLESILERTAETVGDITLPVLEHFFQIYPDARTSFGELGFGKPGELEAQMVENAVYCLMAWHERPGEISVLLSGSIPHHLETLHIPISWYRGLLNSTIDVIKETIPADRISERAVLAEIRKGLMDIFDMTESGLKEDQSAQ